MIKESESSVVGVRQESHCNYESNNRSCENLSNQAQSNLRPELKNSVPPQNIHHHEGLSPTRSCPGHAGTCSEPDVLLLLQRGLSRNSPFIHWEQLWDLLHDPRRIRIRPILARIQPQSVRVCSRPAVRAAADTMRAPSNTPKPAAPRPAKISKVPPSTSAVDTRGQPIMTRTPPAQTMLNRRAVQSPILSRRPSTIHPDQTVRTSPRLVVNWRSRSDRASGLLSRTWLRDFPPRKKSTWRSWTLGTVIPRSP